MKLAFLQDTYDHTGPFTTVYLDTSGDAEDASKALELRWRSAREQLAGLGASKDTLEALDGWVGEHSSQSRAGGKGQVLVATGGEVLFADELAERPTQFSDDELVTFDTVPHLMPYLHLRGARIPHVLAMVDREGADISAVDAARWHGARPVEAEGHPRRKSLSGHAKPQGSEQRHRNAVEEQWKQSADEVADEITRDARQIDAEVIVLGGDPQLRSYVQDSLRTGVEQLVVETDASHRGAKENNERLRDDVAGAVTSAVESRVEATLNEFETERGNDKRATEGWQATVEALQLGQVQTVLWARSADGSHAQGTLSIGAGANEIAFDDASLKEMGTDWVEHVRAEDAVLRAAVGTRAELVLVDPGKVSLADGVGAVLRFSLSDSGS